MSHHDNKSKRESQKNMNQQDGDKLIQERRSTEVKEEASRHEDPENMQNAQSPSNQTSLHRVKSKDLEDKEDER